MAEATRFLAETLVDLGHDVVVATSSTTLSDERCNVFFLNGVKVTQFSLFHRSPGAWRRSPEEEKRYWDFLFSVQPDILISECWDVWSTLLSIDVIRKFKYPKIMVSHGLALHLREGGAPPPFFGFGRSSLGVLWVLRHIPELIARYDRSVFLNNTTGFGRFLDHSLAKIIKPKSIRIIPNSANLQEVRSSMGTFRDKHGINKGPLVLCIANYSLRKNQELAIKAFCEACVAGSTLVCIGSESNEYYYRLKGLLDETYLKKEKKIKVMLLSNIPRSEILSAYVDSDIVLLTAKAETQPIVLIESMAYGKPWIATVSGCISTMEGGIPVNSMEEIVAALQHLMTNPAAAEILGKKGKAAYESRYSPSVVKQLWKKLIEEF